MMRRRARADAERGSSEMKASESIRYFAPTFFFAAGSTTFPLSFSFSFAAAARTSSGVAAAADDDEAESSFLLIFVTCAPAGIAFSTLVSSISMFCRDTQRGRVSKCADERVTCARCVTLVADLQVSAQSARPVQHQQTIAMQLLQRTLRQLIQLLRVLTEQKSKGRRVSEGYDGTGFAACTLLRFPPADLFQLRLSEFKECLDTLVADVKRVRIRP